MWSRPSSSPGHDMDPAAHTLTHTNHLSTPLVPLQVWQVRDLAETQPLPEAPGCFPPGTWQPFTLAAGRASGRWGGTGEEAAGGLSGEGRWWTLATASVRLFSPSSEIKRAHVCYRCTSAVSSPSCVSDQHPQLTAAPALELDTQVVPRSDVCTAAPGQSRAGSELVYTSPVDTLTWLLAFHLFAKDWNFNGWRAGGDARTGATRRKAQPSVSVGWVVAGGGAARAEEGAAPARAICRQERRIVSSAKALVHTRVFMGTIISKLLSYKPGVGAYIWCYARLKVTVSVREAVNYSLIDFTRKSNLKKSRHVSEQ